MNRRDFMVSGATLAVSSLLTNKAFSADSGQINVANSPLKNALDVYYDFLTNLCLGQGFGGDQRLLLCNTITPFSIALDTPYFSQGLFRNYADRVFSGDPMKAVGPANRADRFSYTYSDLINVLNSRIEQNHPEIASKISTKKATLKSNNADVMKFMSDVQSMWKQQPESNLPDSDSRYVLGYLTFLDNIKYESQLQFYQGQIDDTLREIDAIQRTVYAPWEQQVLDNYNALEPDMSESRPLQPTFERSWALAKKPPLTDLDFSSNIFRVPTLFDVTPGIFPLSDLNAFIQNPGARSFSINSSSQYTYTHDKQWGAGGSVSYLFFSVGAGAQGNSHFSQDINKAQSLTIGYQNIEEILADRQQWFNPGVFEDPHVMKIVGNLPAYQRLQYVSVSVIIARGLSLTVNFSSSVASDTWTHQQINASGGISIFGVTYGGHAGTTDDQTQISISKDGKTLTFQDGPAVCRVLGYRVEPFVTPSATRAAAEAVSDASFTKALSQFKQGTISYKQLQLSKFTKQ